MNQLLKFKLFIFITICFGASTTTLSQAPTNDNCGGAIILTIGQCSASNVFDNTGATRSSSPDFLCGWSGEGRDVWFAAIVPASGNITFEIFEVHGSSIGQEVIMELHEGSCGNLTPLACNHIKDQYNNWEPFPKIELTNRTPGETIYARVTGWHDSEGQFQICATDAYGSYPCRIDLVTLGNQGSCAPNTNTYDQELIIHYREDGNANNRLSLFNQQFDITGSPQTVTVSMPAHGSIQDISARIEGDWSYCIANADYFNGGGLQTQPYCYNGSVSNDECSGAISLTVSTSCTEYIGNNIGATRTEGNGVDGYFECHFAGHYVQDVWYSFVVPSSGSVVINTYQPGNMQAAFEVYQGNCGALVRVDNCLPQNQWEGPGTPWHSMRLDGRPAGQTLYIRVADIGGDTQGEFGICVIEPEVFSNDICASAINVPIGSVCNGLVYSMHPSTASNNPTTHVSCDDQGKPASEDVWFKVTAPASGSFTIKTEEVEQGYSNLVMEAFEGSCTGLSLINCDDSSGEHGHPSIALSNRTAGETIFIRISEVNTNNGSAFSICATTVDSDACSVATPLPVDGNCQTFDNTGTTPSNNPSPEFLCGWDDLGADMWFSAQIPASGNLSVEINMVDGGPYNVIMELIEGPCNNLTRIACSQERDDYTNRQPYPKVEIEGRQPGETIYIRVTGSNNDTGPFDICVSDAGYSDPCKIELMIPGNQSSCDPVTNTYTQDFLVYYRHDGSVNSFSVNDKSFVITGSPQMVTLTLPANGGSQNIGARFDGDWSLCTANSVYSFGNAIQAPQNCFNGTVVNDDPCDAIFLAVSDGCIEYVGNNTGATHSMGNGINYNFECNWAGDSPQDIYYKFEVPSSGSVVVNTYRIDQDIDAVFEVYTGGCSGLSYIGGCAGDPRASKRYDGITPGDILYVRVAAVNNGGIQGNFGICIIEPEPMTNDVCASAIDLPVSTSCLGDIYSMHHATPSNQPSAIQSCEDPYHNPSRDIWFKVTVPASGIVYISTEQVERGEDDMVMSIYEGVCGNLVEIECNHANRSYGQVSTSVYGRQAGEVLYVRISQWGSWSEENDYSAIRVCAIGADGAQAAYYQSDCYMDRHNTSLNTAWLSCSGSSNPNTNRSQEHWALFELDEAKGLTELHLWNINHPDYLNNGAQSIAIDYMDSNGAWQELGQYSVTRANASAFYEGEVIDLQGSAQSDQFLLTILDNYGGDCSGLAEVRLGVSSSPCLNAIDLAYPIDNVNNFENLVYKTNETITGDITIQSDGHLTLDAKHGVYMNPGFEVSDMALLEVFLDGCDQQNGGSNGSSNDTIQYIGAGITDGFTLSVSSSENQSVGANSINGSGMDAEYMLASRFLAQASLGFEESHVDQVLQLGYEGWIDEQMAVPTSHYLDITLDAYEELTQLFLDNTPNPTETDLFALSEANTWRDFYSVWWTVHEDNEDLLRQRIALALSEIFVISTNVDGIADEATGVADFYDMLLDHSFGNFRDLIEDVSLHACMGFYLSHLNNPKTDLANNIFPDENYAREIMQLFTIGLYELNPDGTNKLDGNGNLIPTYDNGHIKEMAKVFTGLGGSAFGKRYIDEANENGWNIPDPPGFGSHDLYSLAGDEPMIMYDAWHEAGPKTIVGDNVIPGGQTGMQDIDMALDILFNHDNVGPFIGKQLIQRLVKSNPSPAYVQRVTNVFNNNGSGVRGDLGAVIKAILLDEEARDCLFIQNPSNGKLREPIVKYLHLSRSLGIDPTVNPHIKYYRADLGFHAKQDPLRAPSVFNFFLPNYSPVGPVNQVGLVAPEFQIYDSQTSIGNANLMHGPSIWSTIFFEPHIYDGDNDINGSKNVYLNFSNLVELTDDEELINYLDKIFTHGRLSDRTRNIVRDAIAPMHDWDPIGHHRESLALYLILNSPDYNIFK